jgi:hypothetical protein
MSLEALSALGHRPALPPADATALAGHLALTDLAPELQALQQQQAEAAADAGGMPASPPDDNDGTVPPPKEVLALVSALMADSAAALQVPGILADSAALVLVRAGCDTAAGGGGSGDIADDAAEAAALQPVGREAQRALVGLLEPLRWAAGARGWGARGRPGAQPRRLVSGPQVVSGPRDGLLRIDTPRPAPRQPPRA